MTHTRGRFVVLVNNTTIFYAMLCIFVVLLLTAYFIRRSKYGLALQSIGEDEEAAAHTGINITALKTIVFAVSAIFIGATGAIMATRWTYIDPYIAFSPLFSFMPVLMAIFGGMGQFYGPIIGAAIFAYLEEILITRFPYYYMLIFGLILIISILYLPNGLVGLVQKWRKGDLVEQHANP
jgi:branched-chain amino acid transport system permease protein